MRTLATLTCIVAASLAQPVCAQQSGSLEARRADVEARFIVGPQAAPMFGLTGVWQGSIPLASGARPTAAFADGDFLGVVDSHNILSRFGLSDGSMRWQRQVGDAHDRVHGVHRADTSAGERIFITNDADIHSLDGATGSPAGLQTLSTYPSSGSVMYGPYVIYGTKTGRIQWQHAEVGAPWRVHSLRGSIDADVERAGDRLAVASAGGSVAVLDADTTDALWTRRDVGGVREDIAFDGTLVWIATEDQAVMALSARNGEIVWKHVVSEPIRSAVELVGDRIFVDLPNEGITCFDAQGSAGDSPPLWSANGSAEKGSSELVHGRVLGFAGAACLVWVESTHELLALNAKTGVLMSNFRTATGPRMPARLALPSVGVVATELDQRGQLRALVLVTDGGIVQVLRSQG